MPLRRLLLVPFATALGPVALAGCTSDLPAPSVFLDSDGDDSGGDGGALTVDCGTVPLGAVGANFSHTVSASGGDGSYTWQAAGLPDGLSIDTGTGLVSGVPTTEGSYRVSLAVTDGAMEMGSAACDLDVNPQIVVDLGTGRALPCVIGGESAADFITPGTGNQTPPTCSAPGGRGNMDVPAGITLEPDCTTSGTLTETRYGTYVWMVEVNQSGATAYVPYCATQDAQDRGAYTIEVRHGGDDTTEKVLVPATGTFDDPAGLSFGESGDPLFTVRGCPTNPCFYAFSFTYDANPFADIMLGQDTRIDDMDGMPEGFTHELMAAGPWSDTDFNGRFGGRPWTFAVDMDYCMAGSMAECDPASNGDGELHFSVIMNPAP